MFVLGGWWIVIANMEDPAVPSSSFHVAEFVSALHEKECGEAVFTAGVAAPHAARLLQSFTQLWYLTTEPLPFWFLVKPAFSVVLAVHTFTKLSLSVLATWPKDIRKVQLRKLVSWS